MAKKAAKKTKKDEVAEEAAAAPSLNVLAQYIKDLSFENPHSPHSLRPREIRRKSTSTSM